MTLDITKANVWEMQLQWYGAGPRVSFYINQFLVHREMFANSFDGPWSRTLHLPMQWRVENDSGASTASSMHVLGSSVDIIGQINSNQLTFAARNLVNVSVSNTSEVGLIALRPKALFNSVINRSLIIPFRGEVSSDGGNASIDIYYNVASVTGGTWTSDSTSHAEYNTTFTSFSATGAQRIYAGVVTDGTVTPLRDLDRRFNRLARTLNLRNYTNDQTTLLIACRKLKGGTTDMRAALAWDESV
jgi:hypothetical protein